MQRIKPDSRDLDSLGYPNGLRDEGVDEEESGSRAVYTGKADSRVN
jgi:hypothetical protein